jgi:hypothetical protein|tara:strand:- start:185 stop:724 length:540 start_codon:yes stop_codon:yes gene_type:complete
MANGTLKVGTITTSSGSGNISIGSGVTVNVNRPAFEAVMSSDQSISDDSTTKITFNSEVFDTDDAYDPSTNYRFTIPTGGAGKYNVYLNVGLKSGSNANFYYGAAYLYKNGSAVRMHWIDTRTNYGREYTAVIQTSLDLSEGDYLEAYGYVDVGSSTPTIENAKGSTSLSVFGAYKIGA